MIGIPLGGAVEAPSSSHSLPMSGHLGAARRIPRPAGKRGASG